MIDLSTTLGNAWFPSPLFTASGCASSGKELAQFIDLREIGAVVTKSVMSKPRHGRATPRTVSYTHLTLPTILRV